ncbi:alpha/beta hydrolase, partial [Vibrio sp. 2132-1]|uniref:alpha/beta hydrolase n=1 Tax=Vibrio sp. 2132-1 TaxID=3074598 RepID=UPI00296703C8
TYRMPNEGHEFGAWPPLADAQRAMRLVRQLPLASHLSSIGVLGFSAGGHVAASLATSHALDIYPLQDEADRVSAKPDFCALMYPVISMNTDIAHMGSRAELLANLERESDLLRFSLEKQVTSDMPPCFLLHASDDTAVSAENSLVFWQALRQHEIATEMHLFEQGKHGFGIRDAQGLPVAAWPQLLSAWLQ